MTKKKVLPGAFQLSEDEEEDFSEMVCDLHLKDLQAHHQHGTGELRISPSDGGPRRISAHVTRSYIGSSAAACCD